MYSPTNDVCANLSSDSRTSIISCMIEQIPSR